MKKAQTNRRSFIKESVTTAASVAMISALAQETLAENRTVHEGDRVGPSSAQLTNQGTPKAPRIRFSVIGINHDHIHSQIGAVIRGGGQFVSFYAKEPDLVDKFTKRYPEVKL